MPPKESRKPTFPAFFNDEPGKLCQEIISPGRSFTISASHCTVPNPPGKSIVQVEYCSSCSCTLRRCFINKGRFDRLRHSEYTSSRGLLITIDTRMLRLRPAATFSTE